MPQVKNYNPRTWKQYWNPENPSRRIGRGLCVTAGLAMLLLPPPCAGQARPYIGFLGGVSTLSADGQSAIGPQTSAISSYKPGNGFTFDAFAGLHWNNFLSFQADYLSNRNPLTLD